MNNLKRLLHLYTKPVLMALLALLSSSLCIKSLAVASSDSQNLEQKNAKHKLENQSPLKQLKGTIAQGALLVGKVEPGTQIKVDGRSLLTSAEGDFVFGLGRDYGSELSIEFVDGDGVEGKQVFQVQPRKYNIQKIEGVKSKHVNPPEQVLQRIRDEAKQVRAARALDDPRLDYLQDFIWPLSGPITGVYGSQRVYNGVPKSPHYGLDIAAPTGTKVVAPAAGLVTLAEDDLYYSGGTLILDHGYGVSSTFIHLSRLLVKPGEHVKQGQEIAEVGATGRATGPHLDWRMNWFDVRVDPELFMAGKPMPQTDSGKQ